MIIENGNILYEDGVVKNGTLYIDGEYISENGDGIKIDATDCYVLPGLIDTHVHGCLNTNCSSPDPEAARTLSTFSASHGVTSVVPTVSVLPVPEMRAAIEAINTAKQIGGGAKIAGIHLEGPFLSVAKKGAMVAENIKRGDPTVYDKITACEGGDLVKLVTVAPENEGADKIIPYLKEKGITVSVGHSDATYSVARHAVDIGATQATHTYNAMRSLNHREPAILGEVMNDERVKCELICDFIHVSPTACEILIKLKGVDNINMISDGEWGTGLPDGPYYDDRGRLQYIIDGIQQLENGTITGSTKWLLYGVQNMVKSGILSLADAIKCASLNPAKTLKIDNITGSIKIGKKADIIILDRNLELLYTIVDGKIVYSK